MVVPLDAKMGHDHRYLHMATQVLEEVDLRVAHIVDSAWQGRKVEGSKALDKGNLKGMSTLVSFRLGLVQKLRDQVRGLQMHYDLMVQQMMLVNLVHYLVWLCQLEKDLNLKESVFAMQSP